MGRSQPEAAGAVGHQPLALGAADGGAQVRLARQARLTLTAFGRVERDNVVADRYRGDAGADFAHDPGAFMAEDRREDALAVLALQRIGVGVAHARGHDLHQHFAGARPLQVDLVDLERLVGGDGDGGSGLHSLILVL
jgi:hypothetical protein